MARARFSTPMNSSLLPLASNFCNVFSILDLVPFFISYQHLAIEVCTVLAVDQMFLSNKCMNNYIYKKGCLPILEKKNDYTTQ